jgi:hypothetical protein
MGGWTDILFCKNLTKESSCGANYAQMHALPELLVLNSSKLLIY